MEEKGGDELVRTPTGLERRRQEVVRLHQLTHGADAAAFGFGHVDFVQHGRDTRVSCFAARLPNCSSALIEWPGFLTSSLLAYRMIWMAP